jgi:hypothetical protein
MSLRRCTTAALLLLGLPLQTAAAQLPAWTPLPLLTGDADDRARLGHLLGRAGSARFLLRGTSDALDSLPGPRDRLRWALFAPDVGIVYNPALPFSLNDGPLWAARGWSEDVRAGGRAQWGRFSLVLAPELVATENLPYDLPPPEVQLPRPPGRSVFSTPWHVGEYSIDLPLRFGERGFRRLDPGQSTLAVDLGAVTAGLSTENEWWGPGIRNAIVLSNNAAGIPRAFVRTTRPLRTRIGTIAARWFLGGLFESRYFDATWQNDRRSITGLGTTLTPAGMPNLTVGFTRAVYASMLGWEDVFGHALDVLKDRGFYRAPGDTTVRPSRDQVFSFFGRWIFPADGLAVHAEWARTDPPHSLRDLLTNPNHSQGYTLGLEWTRPVRAGRDAVRFQAEVTYLEKPPSYRNLPEITWYTGAAAPQGYTQRGQVLGAAIGPGASSQWMAVEYFAPTWRAGLFGGRVRWDDDALYTFPGVYDNKWCSHDVSLFGGARGAVQSRWGRLEAAVTAGQRLNVFFYHVTWCGPEAARLDVLDVRTTTLQLRFSPR